MQRAQSAATVVWPDWSVVIDVINHFEQQAGVRFLDDSGALTHRAALPRSRARRQ